MRALVAAVLFVPFSLVPFSLGSQAVFAQDVFVGSDLLLEDFEGNGPFTVDDWANTETDSEGNANSAQDAGDYGTVTWATQWSGIPSTNYDGVDLSKYKTYQVDVMVEEGQPVEEGSNFYLQLLSKTDVGYAYWEAYIPQTLVPADGNWYRVRVPIDSMNAKAGDGAEEPADLKTIVGCCNGMNFDEDGSKFKFKKCGFDNVKVSTLQIEEAEVKPVPAKDDTKEFVE